MYGLAIGSSFSLPNICKSSSTKSLSSSSSSSSSSSGKYLCVGVSYTASFEFEAFAGVVTCVSECLEGRRLRDINCLLSLAEGDRNCLEYDVSCNTFYKKSAIACICVLGLTSASRIFLRYLTYLSSGRSLLFYLLHLLGALDFSAERREVEGRLSL